jgi:hypothetical protein
MSEAIWEATLNERYQVVVRPVGEYVAVLEVFDGQTWVFIDNVPLTLSAKIGVDQGDIEKWKQIVEDFVDESKFSFN